MNGLFYGISDGDTIKQSDQKTHEHWMDRLGLSFPILNYELKDISQEVELVHSLSEDFSLDILKNSYTSYPLSYNIRSYLLNVLTPDFTEVPKQLWNKAVDCLPLLCPRCNAPYPTYIYKIDGELCHRCMTFQVLVV